MWAMRISMSHMRAKLVVFGGLGFLLSVALTGGSNGAAAVAAKNVGEVVLAVAVPLLIVAVVSGLYLLPAIVAWRRGVPNLGSIAVINVLLGWTLIGWTVALAMAARTTVVLPVALPARRNDDEPVF
jgi:hypothetical protein